MHSNIQQPLSEGTGQTLNRSIRMSKTQGPTGRPVAAG